METITKKLWEKSKILGGCDMIFIAIGTHTQGFDRLLIEIDELVKNKTIKQKVFAQIGSSRYKPKHYPFFKTCTHGKMINYIKKSKITITHGGAGLIIDCLVNNKKPIIVPRLSKFGEAVNNHQLELAQELSKTNKITAVYNIRTLENAIKNSKKLKFKSKNKKLLINIKKYIEKL